MMLYLFLTLLFTQVINIINNEKLFYLTKKMPFCLLSTYQHYNNYY